MPATAMPSGDSLDQVSRTLWAVLSREDRRSVLSLLAARAGLDLRPAATWLLARLDENPGVDLAALGSRYSVDPGLLAGGLADLQQQGLAREARTLTPAGRNAVERLVAARRAGLTELLADWSPEQHGALADYLRRVARDFAAQPPA
jgi:DNA-binding MarR family transcriptional regulator